ncbi:hypothetical protein JYT97_03650 [Haliea sp. AH-315-K21]|uniref:Uncharacterized protein n=1 Tax=SAR86 cluster bacterium TaxID=2030880 RepID=A0A2A5CAR0_9GAMM|nr:hypothetical protein [Haliea sp. AH-315-K21]PCJ40939.1 MAG: hypothetical protein COA71_10085 [SAR86 cluster bacterium]
MKFFNMVLLTTTALLVSASSLAQLVTFESGTPASASEMNANFATVVEAIETLETKVAALEDAESNRDVTNRSYRVFAFHNRIEQQVNAEDATFLDIVSAGTFVISFDADSATFATVQGVTQEREIGMGWSLVDPDPGVMDDEYEAPTPPFMSDTMTEILTGANGLLLPYTQNEIGLINIDGIEAVFNVSPSGGVLFGGSRLIGADSFEAGLYIGVEVFPVDQ